MASQYILPIAEGISSLGATAANIFVARKNRKWQERMANTALQRKVRDAKKLVLILCLLSVLLELLRLPATWLPLVALYLVLLKSI